MGLRDRIKGITEISAAQSAIERRKRIESQIPGITVSTSESPDLSFGDRHMGRGGQGSVERATYQGKPAVVKSSPINDDNDIEKLKKYYTILVHLGFKPFDRSEPLFPTIQHVLIPLEIMVYEPFAGQLSAIEIFPLCDNKYKLVKNFHILIKFLHDIVSALSEMHHRNLVHLDVKQDNILMSDSTPKTPLLADLGTATLFSKTSQKLVTISTTISLILENEFIRRICLDRNFLLQENITSEFRLFNLVSYCTPELGLIHVDALLVGIWIVDFYKYKFSGEPLPPIHSPYPFPSLQELPPPSTAFAPSSPYPSLPSSGIHMTHSKASPLPHHPLDVPFRTPFSDRSTTLRDCGQQLIVNSLWRLFPIWAKALGNKTLIYEKYFSVLEIPSRNINTLDVLKLVTDNYVHAAL